MNYAMIPDDFKETTLDSYIQETAIQRKMFDLVERYLTDFPFIKNEKQNSLGFIAKYGETRINEMGVHKHDPRYNSFGLGKTHLKIGAAKWLIDEGYTVLIVKDVVVMDELVNARRSDDGGEEYNRIISRLINAPVLVWDDLGKSNPTQAKERIYFHIFNERAQARRPILFSSNEDADTLSERIGGGAWSRLAGMSGKYLMATYGPDFRLTGARANG